MGPLGLWAPWGRPPLRLVPPLFKRFLRPWSVPRSKSTSCHHRLPFFTQGHASANLGNSKLRSEHPRRRRMQRCVWCNQNSGMFVPWAPEGAALWAALPQITLLPNFRLHHNAREASENKWRQRLSGLQLGFSAIGSSLLSLCRHVHARGRASELRRRGVVRCNISKKCLSLLIAASVIRCQEC